MRSNAADATLKKNDVQKYQFLVGEYEEVKAKKHPVFKFAKDFYAAHGTCPHKLSCNNIFKASSSTRFRQ